MRLTVEIEGNGIAPALPSDGADLVALMSFAVVRGFGANHPLIAFADRLHDVHHVRLGPLTTFYEAKAEDAEDREKLELSWQPAAALAESLAAISAALASDAQLRALVHRAGSADLAAQIATLQAQLAAPAADGKRVRLGYEL
jgi:hypothetical protein